MSVKNTFLFTDHGSLKIVNGDDSQSLMVYKHSITPTISTKDRVLDTISLVRNMLQQNQASVLIVEHQEEDGLLDSNSYFASPAFLEWRDLARQLQVKHVWILPPMFLHSKDPHEMNNLYSEFQSMAEEAVWLDTNIYIGVTNPEIRVLRVDEVDDFDYSGKLPNRIECRIMPSDSNEQELEDISSPVLQLSITVDGVENSCSFLIGRDAEARVMAGLEVNYGNLDPWTSYDLLLEPSICWHYMQYVGLKNDGAYSNTSFGRYLELQLNNPSSVPTAFTIELLSSGLKLK